MSATDATREKNGQTTPVRERESNVRGGARAALLLAIAGAGLLLAAVLFLDAPEQASPSEGSHSSERAPAPASASEVPPAPVPPPRAETEESGDAPTLPHAGEGRLRIFLVDPPEGPRTVDCSVDIGPTSLLLAPGTAVARTSVVPRGSDRCVFEDLPDAAYLVRASGPGLSAVSTPVAIGPGGRDLAVRLVLRRAVFVDGVVLDEEGTPLEGVVVRLEEERPGKARLEGKSDAAGRYRIEEVTSGIYRLFVGPQEAAYLPPLRIALEDAPLRHDVRLPILGSAEIAVADGEGRPLPAQVDGFGPPGGTFHLQTPPEGIVLARNLPAGDYRISVRADGYLQRYVEAKVAAREKASVRVVLEAAR
ncbi:MAG: carboxypeptidase-like regulatory domain-containing protein [Planctomycetes bacterium]|nr:carboxypeptidase-like regulatory domain-containing protein [Planctomycetota bacterium]